MRRLLTISLIAFAIALPGECANLFWVFAPAGCIASAGDGVSTAMAISAGAHETNPILTQKNTGHNGNLNLPLEIAGKATMCGVPFLIRYLFHRHGDDSIGNNIGAEFGGLGATTYSYAVFHNLGVLKQQKKIERGQQ